MAFPPALTLVILATRQTGALQMPPAKAAYDLLLINSVRVWSQCGMQAALWQVVTPLPLEPAYTVYDILYIVCHLYEDTDASKPGQTQEPLRHLAYQILAICDIVCIY